MRVQIPTYTDRWMMGDHYGRVIGQGDSRQRPGTWVYVVKLDKSGKTVRVVADDCKEV